MQVFFFLHFACYKLIPGLYYYRAAGDEGGSGVLPFAAKRRENKFLWTYSSIMLLTGAQLRKAREARL